MNRKRATTVICMCIMLLSLLAGCVSECEVPDVMNQNIKGAKLILQEAGFENIVIAQEDGSAIVDGSEYIVTKQSPEAGFSASASHEISLSVASCEERAKDVANDLSIMLSMSKNSLDPRSFQDEYCKYYPYMSEDDKEIYERAYGVSLCYREQESVINEIKEGLKSPDSFVLSSYEPSTVVSYSEEDNMYTAYIAVGYNASNSFGVSLRGNAKVRVYFTISKDDGLGWTNSISVL